MVIFTLLLDQFFFLRSSYIRVDLLSYERKRLINERKTTRGLIKNWRGNQEIKPSVKSIQVTIMLLLPVKIFFCDPVVIYSIRYYSTAKLLNNESNTTEWPKKWTGYPGSLSSSLGTLIAIFCFTSFKLVQQM